MSGGDAFDYCEDCGQELTSDREKRVGTCDECWQDLMLLGDDDDMEDEDE